MKRNFLNVDPISGIATHAGFALIFFTSALLLFLKKHNNEFSFKELQTFKILTMVYIIHEAHL